MEVIWGHMIPVFGTRDPTRPLCWVLYGRNHRTTYQPGKSILDGVIERRRLVRGTGSGLDTIQYCSFRQMEEQSELTNRLIQSWTMADLVL
jgi:hypothetical protein